MSQGFQFLCLPKPLEIAARPALVAASVSAVAAAMATAAAPAAASATAPAVVPAAAVRELALWHRRWVVHLAVAKPALRNTTHHDSMNKCAAGSQSAPSSGAAMAV